MQKHSSQLLLIVENDPDITVLLRTILKMKTNYQILTATDGRDALQILDKLAHASYQQEHEQKRTGSLAICPNSGSTVASNRLPDLILTDLNMPGLNGLDLCRILRKNATYQQIPLIMLSAYSYDLPEDLPVDYFVAKPFRVPSLLDAISQALCLMTART